MAATGPVDGHARVLAVDDDRVVVPAIACQHGCLAMM